MERREALDAELNKPVNHPITGKPAGDQQPEKKGRASDEYKPCFLKMPHIILPKPV